MLIRLPRTILFIAIACLCSYVAQNTFGTTYYVDPGTGLDSAAGAKTSPWKTIAKAKTSVKAGDIVYLRPGTYPSTTFGTTGDKFGSAGNYITYANDPESAPYSAQLPYIEFKGANAFYIAISGLDIYAPAPSAHGIKIGDSATSGYGEYVKIVNCKVHGNAGSLNRVDGPNIALIGIYKSRNITIEDCELYNSGCYGALLITNQDVTIRGCRIHHIPRSGINSSGDGPYTFEYNILYEQHPEWGPVAPNDFHGSGFAMHSNMVTMRGNVIYNYGNTRPIRWYQSVVPVDGYHDCLVENNLVFRTSDFTGTMWWPEIVDAGENFVVRNNTFVGGGLQIHLAQNADGSGLSVYNNIVTESFMLNNWGTYYTGGTDALKAQTCEQARSKWNNVKEGGNLYGSLVATAAGYQCKYTSFSSTSTSKVGVSFAVGTLFSSGASAYPFASGYPYQLKAGSLAIGFGNKANATPIDILKLTRDTSPDAGCYEFGGSSGGGTPQNLPPVFDTIGNKTIKAGSTLAFSVKATDPEGKGVTYGVTVLPANATFNGSSFSWTPTAAQVNTYSVEFTATDGALWASQTIQIVVTESESVPVDPMVGYWKLDDAAGTVVGDSSGLQNTGSLVGATWSEGKVLGAASFDGVDDYASLGSASCLNLRGSLTVAAWVLPNNYGQSGYARILHKGTDTTGYSVHLDSANGSLAYAAYGADVVRSNTQVITLNAWQHVAVTYDAAAGVVKFYVNGLAAGTAAYTVSPKDSSTQPLLLGIKGGDTTRAFAGHIDEVRLYNTALSETDIAQIHQNDSRRYTLTVYSDNGVVTCDPAAKGYALNQNVTLTATPNSGYKFTGWTRDLISMANPATITITGNTTVRAGFAAIQNTAPVFTAVADKTVDAGTLLTFKVQAVDAEGNPVTYSAQNLPAGASFVGDTFSWTPQAAGTCSVGFTASDGTTTSSIAVGITVRANAPDGLVLWMQLDDTPSDGVLDSSTYGNNGTSTKLPTLVSGYFKNAYSFDGVDDFVAVADTASLDVTQVTLGAWINVKAYKDDQRIISKETGTSSPYSVYTLLLSGTGEKRLELRLGIGGARKVITSNANIPLNTWTHVAATYDGLKAVLYINGKADKTASITGAIQVNDKPVYIGASQFYGRVFSGAIDDAVIYNRALSASDIAVLIQANNNAPVLAAIPGAEVTAGALLTFQISGSDVDGDVLSYSAASMPAGAAFTGNTFAWMPTASQVGTYKVVFTVSDGELGSSQTVTITVKAAGTSGPADSRLVLHMAFEDNPADGVLDSSTYLNNGLVTAGSIPAWTYGYLAFDGVNDYVKVPNSASLPAGNITISAWVYLNSYKDNQVIVAKEYGTGAPYSSYRLGMGAYSLSNKLQFQLGTSGTRKVINSTSDIPLNTWTHVACTYNGSAVTLYINGAVNTVRNYVYGAINVSANPIYIGMGQYDGVYFAGSIDEVEVYNAALSNAEVAALTQK